jgi:putative SOS response-associated peptidase YedK
MCCRYLLLKEHLIEISVSFGLGEPEDFRSRYNIAPGEAIPAMVVRQPGKRPAAARLNWGLLPAFAKAAADGRFPNARAETLAAKPSFRDAFRHRRCLVPASGFYEWEVRGRERLPWLFRTPEARPFFLAGIWESRRLPDGRDYGTCAIVTTAPNGLMRPIHHRMPLLIAREEADRWLEPGAAAADRLAPLLHPADAGFLAATRVGQRVNRVGHDDPDCLLPPEPDRGLTLDLEFA